MRERRTGLRWFPLWAAVLVVFQLGGILHLATAPHGVCWEHGVVVELEAATSFGESAAVAAGIARAAAPHVRSSEHPHCPALWAFRQARLEVTSTAVVVPSQQHGDAFAVPEQLPPPTGWALRQAPKQSPPV